LSENETIILTPQSNSHPSLKFTGNWFIDAGILGFVNLMEEVYGDAWQNSNETFLNILVKRSSSSDEIKGLFIYAFWYKTIRDTVLRWIGKDNFKKKILKNKYNIKAEELTENIKKKVSESIYSWHSKKTSSMDNRNDFYSLLREFNNYLKGVLEKNYSPYKDALKKIYASNRKNILENLNTIGIIAYNSFFTNLSFFNPASNKFGKEKEVFDKFDNFLNNYFVRDDRFASDLFDKSLSPFVYSASDFKNQLYGKPQTLKSIERAFGINPAYYILSFPLAFLWMKGKYYMFYAQDLRFTYSVNKRLKDLIQRSIKNGKSSVFEITWNIIIDKINEYKAISSLENMYIVEYSDITNQQINNVEYIGISKLQASLIIDDHIREYLNKSIPTPKKVKNKTIWVWLLEEFIKNKPLMLHIVNYIHGKISGDWKENEEKVGKYTLITSLAVDAEIKKMKSRVYGERIFDTDFFSSYKNVVDNVKNTISTMYSSQKATQNVIEKDDKTKIAISLFGYINNRNKYGFVNLLLKYMTGKTTQSVESKGLLVNYLFNNVLSNTICWENYALSIVIGVI